MADTQRPAPSDRGERTFVGLLLTLLAPLLLTLHTVARPRLLVDYGYNPTPLGFTKSLSLLMVPLAVLLFAERSQRRAIWRTLAVLVPVVLVLDVLFAGKFLVFPYPGAVLGLRVPVRGGVLPIEQLVTTLLCVPTVLFAYVWASESWFPAYRTDDKPALRLSPWSVAMGALLAGGGVLLKHRDTPGMGAFPAYFVLLIAAGFIPAAALLPTARRLLNWRALSFVTLATVLVGVIWEASLALPWQWWGYNHRQMLGLYVNAWSALPLEEPLLWMIGPWLTASLYEVVRARLTAVAPAPASTDALPR